MTEESQVRAYARKGEGTRVNLSVRVTTKARAVLEETAQARGLTASALIRALVERGRICEAGTCPAAAGPAGALAELKSRLRAQAEQIADLKAALDAARPAALPDGWWRSAWPDWPGPHAPPWTYTDEDSLREHYPASFFPVKAPGPAGEEPPW